MKPEEKPTPQEEVTRPYSKVALNNITSPEVRPVGAIFGGLFLCIAVLEKHEDHIVYQVAEIEKSAASSLRQCSNPVCSIVFPSGSIDAQEKYCPSCGQLLQFLHPELVLTESLTPYWQVAHEMAERKLVYVGLLPPVAYFKEMVGNREQHCLVTVKTNPLPLSKSRLSILSWGMRLANCLDYLHQNNLSLQGKINQNSFGLFGNNIVWANFKDAVFIKSQNAPEFQDDLRVLVQQLRKWCDEEGKHEAEQGVSAPRHLFFSLDDTGLTNAGDLARTLEYLLESEKDYLYLDYRVAHISDVGLERQGNEDSVLTVEINRCQQTGGGHWGVYVLADGMGGHSAGEVASGMLVEFMQRKALTDWLSANSGIAVDAAWLAEIVKSANQALYDLRQKLKSDMGSTLVAVLLDHNRAFLAHVGDSRAYLLNANEIRRLTVDHSLVERLIASGQITPEEARRHPQRNVVYRTMGNDVRVEVDQASLTLVPGDRILLCSDGLSGLIEDEEIWRLVRNAPSPDEACTRLVAAANAAGGSDNISVILIEAWRQK